MKCDVCNVESDEVVAGRWIFYCPLHKSKDWEKTYNNEVAGQDDIDMSDGELVEMIENNI